MLPSTVFGCADHKELYVAYSFYNVATTITFNQLMYDALIHAKTMGADVYNMLDIMDNRQCFEPLQFTPGDGTLHYYVYNWKCPKFEGSKLGLVLF
eukprot:UN02289